MNPPAKSKIKKVTNPSRKFKLTEPPSIFELAEIRLKSLFGSEKPKEVIFVERAFEQDSKGQPVLVTTTYYNDGSTQESEGTAMHAQ